MKRAITWTLLFLLTGCNSIRTNMWTRAEDDTLHPDPCCNLKGIPVMLKVPSHLEVTITETFYAQYKPDPTGKTDPVLDAIVLDRPDLDISAQLKYTEKMFLVDPVRVAAGTGSYGFRFGPADGSPTQIKGEDGTETGHGYIHSANFKANDQSIIQGANLLSTVLRLRPKASGKAGIVNLADFDETAEQTIVKMTRTVAYRRFDLGSPCVNDDVMAFIDEHMNKCHVCSADSVASPLTPEPATPKLVIPE